VPVRTPKANPALQLAFRLVATLLTVRETTAVLRLEVYETPPADLLDPIISTLHNNVETENDFANAATIFELKNTRNAHRQKSQLVHLNSVPRLST
jgi:hypothetical protein